MSIYIKGMEMPIGDETITLFLYPDGKVVVCGMLGPLDHYKAVPVPPHGDLIERDTLSKRIKEETINQAEFYADRWHPVVLAYGDCYGKVQNAPTIIPASGKEETE